MEALGAATRRSTTEGASDECSEAHNMYDQLFQRFARNV